MTSLQLAPLTEPYDAAAGRDLAKRYRAAGAVGPKADLRGSARNLNVVVIGAAVVITVLILASTLVARAVTGDERTTIPPIFGAVIPYGTLLILLVFVVVFMVRPRRQRAETWWRLSRFAETNGFAFAPWSPHPTYTSPLFTSSPERALRDHLTSPEFDLGNLSFQIGARGSGSRTRQLGYVAIKLDHPMPHMVLEAVGGPATYIAYDRAQRLSLEGEFDQHFTLYCPAEYERDALYLLTPDLMALLIDETATFDVELAGEWMFAVAPTQLDLTDPAVMQRLFRIIDTVGAKTSQRASRYLDARTPVVAPSLQRRNRMAAGSRLRSPQVVVAMVVAALAVIAMAVPIVAALVAR